MFQFLQIASAPGVIVLQGGCLSVFETCTTVTICTVVCIVAQCLERVPCGPFPYLLTCSHFCSFYKYLGCCTVRRCLFSNFVFVSYSLKTIISSSFARPARRHTKAVVADQAG